MEKYDSQSEEHEFHHALLVTGRAEVAALTGKDISPGMEKFCKIESAHLEWNYRYW